MVVSGRVKLALRLASSFAQEAKHLPELPLYWIHKDEIDIDFLLWLGFTANKCIFLKCSENHRST